MTINTSIFKAYDIRGVYPTDLNEELAYRIAQGYVQYVQPKGKVVAAGMLIGTLTTQQSTGSDKVMAVDTERLQELKQDLFISEFADEDKMIPLIP